MQVTPLMLADLFAFTSLVILALYHLLIYWGRKKEPNEAYNLYFSFFVFTVALFVMVPYFHPNHFLSQLKPSWLYVLNIEAALVMAMFFSGIPFLSLLTKFPKNRRKVFRVTFVSMAINFLLTLTANFISTEFYFKKTLPVILIVVLANTMFMYITYGRWVYHQRLMAQTSFRIIFPGFVLITLNILIYRSVELLNAPQILYWNHLLSAAIVYLFAYALTVKFNDEFFELKDLKINLEKKVFERTEELNKANDQLSEKNNEIETQREEIIAINEQLSKRALELSILDESKSKFYAGISHEFRTPLTLITGPLEIELQKTSDASLKEKYQNMLKQANRLLELINQLLDLSKLQKGAMSIKLEAANFNLFIRSLVSSYTFWAKQSKIQLLLKEECNDTTFPFDADKIEKIITNLITNALKFTQDQGRIEVIVSKPADHDVMQVEVKDNGIGIEPTKLPHIFDPYFQGHVENIRGMHGTGIGLSLVKELVQLHGGTISCESQWHVGTTFKVQFPLTSFSETSGIHFAEVSKENLADLKSGSESSSILVVEDNPDMRQFIISNLPAGFSITEAINGKDGFLKAEYLSPDLIITDIMMPTMDGIEFTNQIKNNEATSHIPIIILTAKASLESKIEGLQAKADDYLTKPFSVVELNLRIANLIANRKKLKEKFSKSIKINPSEITATSIDEKFLQRALAAVEQNMDNPQFDTEEFCRSVGMSRANVHRKLKALTDLSATGFIRTIRLKRAAQLLTQQAGTVAEIAYQTGFSNLSYFTKCFKETFGVLPSGFSEKDKPTELLSSGALSTN